MIAMRSVLLLLPAAMCVGCSAPAIQPMVTSSVQAGEIADAYCKKNGIDWGQSRFIYPQQGGYYVEYIEPGDARIHHGLTVNSDGTVVP